MSHPESLSKVRHRTPTEKGRLFQLKACQLRRSNLEKILRRQVQLMNTHVDSSCAEQLQKELLKLEDFFSDYLKLHQHCLELVRSEDEDQPCGIEALNLAELKIEVEYLEKKRLQEAVKLEAEIGSKRLEIEMEIAKADAKIKVYEDSPSQHSSVLESLPVDENFVNNYVSQLNQGNSKLEEDRVEQSNPNVLIRDSHVGEIAVALQQFQAPEVDLDVFTGSPVDFQYFMATFEQAVEANVQNPYGRLTRLIKYTKGEAKELIKGCINLPIEIFYIEAKKLLQERYGNPYRIVAEHRKQLIAWPRLKPNDAQGFIKFLNYLINFNILMTSLSTPLVCNPELLQTLQSKLPMYLQDRWNRVALKVRKTSTKQVGLADFIHLLEEETALVDDPLFSRGALGDLNSRPLAEKRNFVETFQTGTFEMKCMVCGRHHELETCKDFLAMDVEERHKFVFKKRLCFGCLSPTSATHSVKSCTKKRVCKVCKENHHTIFHGYQPKKKTSHECSISSCTTRMYAQVISLCIVPVKIHHKSNPDLVIETLALLDNGSQGTFIQKNLLNDLKSYWYTNFVKDKDSH